jgi:regulator of nucleoside diphosphate kinase
MPAETISVITELDAARIRELGSRNRAPREAHAALRDLLAKVTERSEIVPGHRVAPDVVTVNSTVSFRDEASDSVHRVSVVFPQDASIAERRISVLSPVGCALLGRSVGDIAWFVLPDGTARAIRLLEVHYQPEASGDYTR